MKLANMHNISEDSVVSSGATLGTGGTSAAREICSSPSLAIFVCGVRDCVSNYKWKGHSVPARPLHRHGRDCSAQAPRAHICSETDIADRNMRGTVNFNHATDHKLEVAPDETTESSDILCMFASFICALLSKLRSLLAC